MPVAEGFLSALAIYSRDLVRKVNETAQIPFTRIEAALDFSFLEVRS